MFKKTRLKEDSLYKIVCIALVLLTIALSFQSSTGGAEFRDGKYRSNFNNYLIFKTSAIHLLEGRDLYKSHPFDYIDLYKYSPIFSMFMSGFTILPDWLGLIIWNLLNLLALIYGLKWLPEISKKQSACILLFIFFELVGSIMNEQSNALMSGLMIMGIAKFEGKSGLWGTFFLVLSVYIKIFSLAVFMMILFYPDRLRNMAYAFMWTVIFALLPIVVTGWNGLTETYLSWFNMLQTDYDSSVGYSLVGILVKWFHFDGNRMMVFVLGVLIMLLPLIRIKRYGQRCFRYLVFSALLIWIIIFNHKAESPTFVIATTGMGLYFVSQKFTINNKILLIVAITFVSLVYSDLMPRTLRDEFFHPYFIKAVPCILIWLKIIYETTFMSRCIESEAAQQ